MRLVVHDYSGHAFPMQLSRALAARGHTVLHIYFKSFQTPKGGLARRPDDPPGLTVRGLDLGTPFAKYSFARRFFQERAFGRLVAAEIAAFAPDICVSGNAPLDVQAAALAASRRAGARFVFWLQDIYGVAIDRILRGRLPVVGAIVGARFLALEKRLLRASDAVVAITDDFRPVLAAWGVPADRVVTVENWAPREELPPRPRDNAWARDHGLVDRLVFLYSGTLGLKHNPDLLLKLAQRFRDRDDVRVAVISEGLGADWLRERKGDLGNLLVLPFQPFERLPEAVASGDVLLAVLEPDAGVFSVPSKVLTYLCAGRPILLAVPPENLAARIVVGAGAGIAVAPGDPAGFVAAAERLAGDADLREAMGKKALDYADRTFDIRAIADRFEAILDRVKKT